MKATPRSDEILLTVNTKTLMRMLGCGRPAAIKIGTAAGAKVTVGERKLLWSVQAIQRYLDTVAQ